MRSEIPQLEVVTAIGDAEAEDYIAQLLFSQGWNIVYRAFDQNSLNQFFLKRSKELRTVLVYRTDLPEFDQSKLSELVTPTITLISLDEIPLNAHQLMQHIRSQLRLPLIVNPIKSPVSQREFRKFETILVTGTQGAPGRSTLALNLALERDLPIYDLDFKAPAIRYLIDRLELEVEMAFLEVEKAREFIPNKDSVIDLGFLPPLGEMVNDRRWHAALLNSIFDSASKLIFVSKATGLSLIRLAKFMEDFPILLRKIPITYVFNQAGNTREERALERKFLKIVAGENAIVIPSDKNVANPTKPGNKVIGKLSALVT